MVIKYNHNGIFPGKPKGKSLHEKINKKKKKIGDDKKWKQNA